MASLRATSLPSLQSLCFQPPPFSPCSPSSLLSSSSCSLILAPISLDCSGRGNSVQKQRRCGSAIHVRNDATEKRPDSDANVVLKLAWYGAEALGNVVAAFSPTNAKVKDGDECASVGDCPITRERAIRAIKEDYEKGYFVTGHVTTGVYKDDCEFADPAGSFKSLKRFKNNCSNFGSLLEKSDVKLTRWEEYEERFIAYWRFSCVLKFPWKPILSSTGFTAYYFDLESGKVCKHIENWDVPKMALLGQIFKPNISLRKRKATS